MVEPQLSTRNNAPAQSHFGAATASEQPGAGGAILRDLPIHNLQKSGEGLTGKVDRQNSFLR